jgi:hypothetical protein
MKKEHIKYILLLLVMFLGIIASIYQYIETFRSEMVSAYEAGKPANGHNWDEMQCTEDLCVNTVNNRLGIETATPSAKLEIDGSVTSWYQPGYGTDTQSSDATTADSNKLNISGLSKGILCGSYYYNLFYVSSTSGTVTYKLNTKATDINVTGSWQNSANSVVYNGHIDYSFDNTNWTTVPGTSITYGSGTVPASGTINLANNNQVYIRYYTEGNGGCYIGINGISFTPIFKSPVFDFATN